LAFTPFAFQRCTSWRTNSSSSPARGSSDTARCCLR
jgi:hypothetical protein